MSLRGRYVLDRIKGVVGKRFGLPVPPYEKEDYWDRVYKDFTPDAHFEWGDLTVSDHLWKFECDSDKYQPYLFERYGYGDQRRNRKSLNNSSADQDAPGNSSSIEGTLSDVLNLRHKTRKKIVLLGCGNSRMGEELLVHGLVGRGDSLIQIDISQKVVYLMQERWKQQKDFYLSNFQTDDDERLEENEEDAISEQKETAKTKTGHLPLPDVQFVHDDARHLTSLESNSIDAVIDKGVIDALHCCDAHDHIHDIMKSVHRVLKSPSSDHHHVGTKPDAGVFATYSFSQPKFLLDRTLLSPTLFADRESMSPTKRKLLAQDMWKNVSVLDIQRILLYRYEKQAQKKHEIQPPVRKIVKKRPDAQNAKVSDKQI